MASETAAVIGGRGHVGLPLAVVNASLGRPTQLYDLDEQAIEQVRAGRPHFLEYGLEPLLEQVLADGMLRLSSDPRVLAEARFVVLVVGTPVDRYLNPEVDAMFRALEPCLPHLRKGQTLILRSTVYPGTSRKIQEWLDERGLGVDVSFRPERMAQGYAVTELRKRVRYGRVEARLHAARGGAE